MLGVALRKFYPSILKRVQSYVFLAIFDKIVGRMTMIIIDLSWLLSQKMFLSALVRGRPLLLRPQRKHQKSLRRASPHALVVAKRSQQQRLKPPSRRAMI
jgi:hypothetical protein